MRTSSITKERSSGHHSAGPVWKYKDGSEVTAKAAAHMDSPDGKSIAWLLLTASGHAGKGKLANVTSVQRLHTMGGQAAGRRRMRCLENQHRGAQQLHGRLLLLRARQVKPLAYG